MPYLGKGGLMVIGPYQQNKTGEHQYQKNLDTEDHQQLDLHFEFENTAKAF
jgi:hypothetical protein